MNVIQKQQLGRIHKGFGVDTEKDETIYDKAIYFDHEIRLFSMAGFVLPDASSGHSRRQTLHT